MKEKTAKLLRKKIYKDYDKITEEFDTTRKYNWKEFESFLPYIKNGQFIADLGCGNGRFYHFIKKHKKIRYLGIDNSKNLLDKAKNQAKAQFVPGDLLKLPIARNKVNVAVAIASLHHIPSKKYREKAVKEMHRILKKNGTVIITVWNLFQKKYKKYIWKARVKHILSLGKYDSRDTFIPWGKSGVKRYYYAFTRRELKQLLEENGFEVISEKTANNIVYICKKY